MRITAIEVIVGVAIAAIVVLTVIGSIDSDDCQDAAKADCVRMKLIPSECKAQRENQCGTEAEVVFVY